MKIPESSTSDVAFESYKGGKNIASYTNGDLVQHAGNLWDNHFKNAGEHPIFMSLNLETPLAFATFLANNANLKKVFIPSTFNMSKLLKSLQT